MKLLRRRPVLSCCLLIVLGCAGLGLWVRQQLPPIFSLADYRPMQASMVYAQGGELIGTFALERRTVVPFALLPQHTVHAFLAAEDADFYAHEGIDWLGVARALIKNMRPGAHLQGASTITQQTVKTLVLGPERSLWRKIKEAILARRLEQMLPKDEILALYLNQIYFGNGAWGIEQAAQTYFAKSVAYLTLSESALLAGIPKNPGRYNLRGDRVATKRRQGYVVRQMVAHQWASAQDAEAAMIEALPEMPEANPDLVGSSAYVEQVRRLLAPTLGDDALTTQGLRIYTHLNVHKQRAALEAMSQGLEDVARRHGYPGAPGHISADLYNVGYQALRRAFQNQWVATHHDEDQLAQGLWDLTDLGPLPKLFGSNIGRQMHIKKLAPLTRTRALVVGFAQDGLSAVVDVGGQRATLPLGLMAWARPYNPKARTPRPKRPADVLRLGDLIDVEVQPWNNRSNEALQVALVPEVRVEGALVAMAPPYGAVEALIGGKDAAAGSGFNRATQARRQPGSAFKPILYAAGLNAHVITPASICSDSPVVITDSATGQVWKPENYEDGRYDGAILYRTALARSKNTCSVRLLQKLGVPALLATAQDMGIDGPLPNNLTLSLGTGEVTPLMMARAMHTLANGGLNVAPHWIERVLDNNDNILPLPEMAPSVRALPEDVAFVLTSMMRSVVEVGTARKAQVLARPLAAKTGTSQLSRDAWLVGFAPSLASVVWMGLDDDTSMGPETGASAALPAWVRFMGMALAQEPAAEFVMPQGVQPARIDAATGLSDGGPESVVEVFVAGTAPDEATTPLPSIFLEDDL